MLANYFIDIDNLWSINGIASDIFTIAVSQAILTPLLNYFSIFLLIRVLKRRSITKAGDNQVTTQQEANNWFEGNPIELSSKYAHAIKIMWLVGFYSPLIPTLFIHGFVALVFTYWMDKYLLFRRYARPSLLGGELNREMIELLEYFPLAMALGNLFFMRVLDNKGNLLPLLLAIGLSSINFIFPSNKINKKLCDSKEEDYLIHSYDEMRLQFPVEYDRANPITRDIAMKEYLEFIKSQKSSDQQAKLLQKIFEKMENNPPKNVF